MEMDAILACIPHRYPMLMVDRVLQIESGQRIRVCKNISANDVLLQGHFPGKPVFPGVMIIETMAQASAIMMHSSAVDMQNSDFFIGNARQVRFLKPVVPGDQLIVDIVLEKAAGNLFIVKGEARVGEALVASGSLTLGIHVHGDD